MLYCKGKKHQNYKCQHFLMLHKTCKYMLETSKKGTFPKFDAGETVYLGGWASILDVLKFIDAYYLFGGECDKFLLIISFLYDIVIKLYVIRGAAVCRHVGMADDADSKSVVGNHVWVQVPLPALRNTLK